MRKLVVVSAIAAVLIGSATAHADQQQRNELKQQLEIMNSIFATAMEQKRGEGAERAMHRNRLSYNYLAGQGVVYRTKIGGGRMVFFDGGVPMPPMPPMPELNDIESIEIEAAMAEGLARAGEVIRELEIVTDEVVVGDGHVFFSSDDGEGNVEVVRHVSREMRDHAREVRELRRRVRDLELAKNHADGDTDAIEEELAAAKAELREREAAVEVARSELEEAREELQAKAVEHRTKRAERKAIELAKFEETMASTLCDYGRTLRALPAQEHVTFIVENGGNEESGKDKIFIFNKQQLDNCSSASDLLSKATAYSF